MTGWQAGRLNLQSSDDIFAEVPDNVGRLIVCLVTACPVLRMNQIETEKLRPQDLAS